MVNPAVQDRITIVPIFTRSFFGSRSLVADIGLPPSNESQAFQCRDSCKLKGETDPSKIAGRTKL